MASALDEAVIVLGSTGFLGSELVDQLLRTTTWKVIAPVRSLSLPLSPSQSQALAVGPTSPSVNSGSYSGERVGGQLHSSSPIPSRRFIRIPLLHGKVTIDSLRAIYKQYIKDEGRILVGIFHVAGLVKHTKRSADVGEMWEANVKVSDEVFAFAKEFQVKVVYASSSGCVGCQRLNHSSAVADDDAPLALEAVAGLPYYEQKCKVEEAWRPKALSNEIEIIFMRPSLLLGPGDRRLSSCQLIYEVMTKKLPFLVPGGVSAVDVRDVARAFIEAMSRNLPSGSAFNITATNNNFSEFVATVTQLAGVQPPRWRLPPFASRSGARIISFTRNLLGLKYDPAVDPVFAEMGLRFWNVRSSRAESELGFHARPINTTLQQTIEYLRSTFNLPTPTGAGYEGSYDADLSGSQRIAKSRTASNRRIRVVVLLVAIATTVLLIWSRR
jgi:dihydroflavonol-4-reductase